MSGTLHRPGTNRAAYRHTRNPRRWAGVSCRDARLNQRSGGLADGLALDLDLHVLADHDAAGLQRHVVDEAERLAVDLGGRAEPEHVVPVRAAADALELDPQVDGLGDTLDGELSVQHDLGAVDRLHA